MGTTCSPRFTHAFTCVVLLLFFYSMIYNTIMIVRITSTPYINPKDHRNFECDKTFYGCCAIYDNCFNDNGTLYSTDLLYIDLPQEDLYGKGCVGISEVIEDYNSHEPRTQFDSGFVWPDHGTCTIHSLCDDYIREQSNDFADYNLSLNLGFGLIHLDTHKLDEEGRNCDSLEQIVMEYNRMNSMKNYHLYLTLLYISFALFGVIFVIFVLEKFHYQPVPSSDKSTLRGSA